MANPLLSKKEMHLRRPALILLVTAVLYLIFVELYSTSLADYDLWGYLAFGRTFWETGKFPYRDLFSYLPTKPLWVYHEWLTGILFYPIYREAGEAGLQLFRYGLVLVTMAMLYTTALKKGGTPLLASSALLLSMWLSCFGYVPVRAQIFTYFFFVLTLYLLERARLERSWKLLAWLMPVMALWCNLHGGFVAGIGLIGLYALGEGLSRRPFIPLLATGFLACLATLINPYGYRYWGVVLAALAMPRPEIEEWNSVIGAIGKHIHLIPAYIFLVTALLSWVCCLFRRRKDLTDLFVLSAVTLIGFLHIRHTVFLGLLVGVQLPAVWTDLWQGVGSARVCLRNWKWLPGAVFMGVALLIHLPIHSWRIPALFPTFRIETVNAGYPVGALQWIWKQGLRGNLLPYFDWGEFLIWNLYPDCRVAMDGRYETVYAATVQREYFDFLFARSSWRVFLDKYPHELILLREGLTVSRLMQAEKNWRVAYRDRESLLFMRNREKPLDSEGSAEKRSGMP